MLGFGTINLKNGEQYSFYNGKEDFARLVHDRLGTEAEVKFREVLDEVRDEEAGKWQEYYE